jgi:hypothetical protein
VRKSLEADNLTVLYELTLDISKQYGPSRLVMGYVRFEVYTAVTMKNGVFWDVRQCGSCKSRRFEGT